MSNNSKARRKSELLERPSLQRQTRSMMMRPMACLMVVLMIMQWNLSNTITAAFVARSTATTTNIAITTMKPLRHGCCASFVTRARSSGNSNNDNKELNNQEFDSIAAAFHVNGSPDARSVSTAATTSAPASTSTSAQSSPTSVTTFMTATMRRPSSTTARSRSTTSTISAAAAAKSTFSTTTGEATTQFQWQEALEEMLDPQTPIGRRQILASELLQANEAIRSSVLTAIRERKLDPLLTPTGRKFQDGTRAVARQITNDILPSLASRSRPVSRSAVNGTTRSGSRSPSTSSSSSTAAAASSSSSPTADASAIDSSRNASRRERDESATAGSNIFRNNPLLPPPPSFPLAGLFPDPVQVSKVGNRILNALQNQVQQTMEILQGDLADPSRIPQRLSQQTDSFVKEAANIWSDTPVGLQEPPYIVIKQTPNYEIRQYESYQVVSTNMAAAGESYSPDQVALSGAAFNSLAAYLFGANRANRVMEMTTPVTTTMSGEMRFYLATGTIDNVPEPLEQDEGKSVYETGSILIQTIPAARLAVRRFTGFVTAGEVSRQKQTLLQSLELDGIALDVDHGVAVGHIIFQYNPPYTLPMMRRNEIAVPVLEEFPPEQE